MTFSARVYYEVWHNCERIVSDVMYGTEEEGEPGVRNYLERLYPDSIIKTQFLGVLPDRRDMRISKYIWLEDCPGCSERHAVIYHSKTGKKRCIACDLEFKAKPRGQ